MNDENYKRLASDPSLYPIAFIERHGQQSSHWELENWQKRERSLCHDMLCILLANLEPSDNLEDVMIKSLKRKTAANSKEEPPTKRIRSDSTETPGPSQTLSDDDSSTQSDDEINYMPEDDYSDDEYDPEAELLNDERITDYRYIVLEGLSTAADIQNYFARKWGLIGINKIFDIIDTKENKFIELKTTVRLDEVLANYAKDVNTGPNTSLITVDLNDNFIDSHNKIDEMPGISKAYNFLIKRRATMKVYGLEDRLYDETPIEKLLFRSDYIKMTIESMVGLFSGNIDSNVDINSVDTSGFTIEPITPNILFETLRKPINEKHEEKCSYKGKITPFFYCKATELDNPNDLYAVDEFILKMSGKLTLIEGDGKLMDAVEKLIGQWLDNTKDNKHFGFIDLNKPAFRDKLDDNIKDALMIGKKGKIHNAELESLVQPEREKIKNQEYPEWFETFYKDMSESNELGECRMGSVEERSRLNMYRYIGEWLDKFYTEVGKRNVGGIIDQFSNFYSRISGTYNTSIGNRTTHSMIACIPIKMNVVDKGTSKRFITGIAFRGPHHTRSATDKSNLLIVEEMKSTNYIPLHFYKKKTIIECGGKKFLIRKTAIKKIDGIHLTFIKNALFIASNMIGDIIMRHQRFISEDAFKALCASHITNESSKNFFIDRVIDACIMAVLGNSRDEGYISMFRKMLMILLNERRQQHSFTFDIKGMCEKLNECLVDNPFSMFLQNSLIYMICNM